MKFPYSFALLFSAFCATAQVDQNTLDQLKEELLSDQVFDEYDLSDLVITDVVPSKASGLIHYYAQQRIQGIPIHGAVLNFSMKDQELLVRGNRFVSGLGAQELVQSPQMNAEEALNRSLAYLNIQTKAKSSELVPLEDFRWEWRDTDMFDEGIPAQLKYWKTGDGLELIWEIAIEPHGSEHWWVLRWSAQSGRLLDQQDLVLSCDFDHEGHSYEGHEQENTEAVQHQLLPILPAQYNVFPLPVESPSHGNRSMVIDPSDSLASPFGWHDDDGQNGAEYTITRGNNVYAYEDENDANQPGFSPDGTAQLNFDFPYATTNTVAANQSAAITNLFYMNNMMHDIWYHYGFDEAAGNFQNNNYGRGGTAGDYVLAEAMDGGGTSNANFATPPDGSNPRMQMYLWGSGGGGGGATFTVNSPTGIAGTYTATAATFGPGLPATPLTADVVLAIDNTAPVNDGCEPLTNGSALSGKIALIDRGSCTFVSKVEAAENAGAVAAVIVNNVPGNPISMGGNGFNIGIPSVMISQADGNLIKTELANGAVNVTLGSTSGSFVAPDGDFDNGIIAHEYGHGISIRISGGPSNSFCLDNAEQMGEGWSDWFGLMLTMEPGDQGSDIRGIGTYAVGQSTTGGGIRPAPYSTDFNINPYTYGNSNDANISVPHGVGFIFATVLWDLNWALINQYGGTPDPDLYSGSGGNNIAMQLVIEALKLQPCNPGMIDGRDAILAADQALYGGIHRCLIWDVFANRGFGFSANQGSSASRSDQVEAFDLPTFCLVPTTPPTASFNAAAVSSCDLEFNFTDNSTNVPQNWLWDFGDGTSSTLQNPSHTYPASGTYTVKLVVSNTVGSDSTTQTVSIVLPAAPTVDELNACSGDSVLATAIGNGSIEWLDLSGNLVATGDTLNLPPLSGPASYLLRDNVTAPPAQVGPLDNSIGAGGYHGTGYHGALNFTAVQGCEILSAWVDADGPGIRSFIVGSGFNTNGATPTGNAIVDQVTVMLVDGPQRVNLNLSVPGPGDYSLGASLTNATAVYRNSNGANYPYTVNGLIDISSSSATTNPTGYYYYLYDLEVQEKACYSDFDTLDIRPAIADFSFTGNGSAISFQDLSTGATDWNWDFGDGNTSTLQNPVHTYASSGNYLVRLSVNGGACTYSLSIDVALSAGEQDMTQQITLLPNPAAGNCLLQWERPTEAPGRVRVLSASGQLIWDTETPSGASSVAVPSRDWAEGIYLIHFQSADMKQVLRLVKNR